MKKNFKMAAVLVITLLVASWTAIHAARIQKERTRMVNKSTPILHVKSVEPGLKFWTERFGFRKTIEVREGDHLCFGARKKIRCKIMSQFFGGMRCYPAILFVTCFRLFFFPAPKTGDGRP